MQATLHVHCTLVNRPKMLFFFVKFYRNQRARESYTPHNKTTVPIYTPIYILKMVENQYLMHYVSKQDSYKAFHGHCPQLN